jgi:hypothetical protein
LPLADATFDLAGASGGHDGELGPSHDNVHLSDAITELLRRTAAEHHHQIIDEQP